MEAVATLAVRVGCEFVYDVGHLTPAVMLVRPNGRGHRVLPGERWEATPETPHHDYRDVYGNVCRRLTLAPGPARLRYDATVEISTQPAEGDVTARVLSIQDLPDDVLMYTLPSRFCLSDELADRAWTLFGRTAPDWTRVQTICDWVHANIAFAYGSSRPITTASDVLNAGAGVCRDFAHVAIAFCRAMNVPARYAFGYLPDIDVPAPNSPMDFCAWFEAYLGDRWWIFDPRNNRRRIGNITIGRGRDALDVAMITTYGDAILKTMTVWADPLQQEDRE